MIKRYSAVLILIFGLLSVSSKAQRAGGNNSLLWRISGKDLAKPSYLFGTMDMICPGDYLWTNSMQECLAKSDKVCFEMNVGDPEVLKSLSKTVLNKNGKKLADYFTPINYPVVVRYVQEKFKVDLSKYQTYNMLAVQPFIIKQLLGCTDAVTYDKRILAEAKKDSKEILGLETVHELMNDVEVTHFNEKIASVLTEMANGSRYYHEYRINLMNAYKQQDIARISTLFKENKLLNKEEQKVFVDDANKRYLSRMPAMMRKSSVFFALNVLNAGGDAGIISLLRKAGYTVEPVY